MIAPYEEHLVHSAHDGCEVDWPIKYSTTDIAGSNIQYQSCTFDLRSKESYPYSGFFFHPAAAQIACCVAGFAWFAYTDSFLSDSCVYAANVKKPQPY
jgi:hypothetical protein